ncbi:hypothetical protein [Chryseobacterium polytrichastri]|uniref:Uncharacterized protein n=1 Tax=Chryseobacterium polytrichastri TaxID=1302687 RepID=A0A1M7DM57_9FLAO|nr:hypothetical protein [Chryseobacterium polytrichastri]SHL80488.1 hypothetical protein SAMN05444267_102539 [Chryseobacterium polytrichastri]
MKATLTLLFLLISLTCFSQAQYICPGSKIPDGWIIVGQTPCGGQCGDRAGQICNMIIIKDISGAKVGVEESACPGSQIPDGWVIVRQEPCGGQCGDRAGQVCNRQIIKKLK